MNVPKINVASALRSAFALALILIVGATIAFAQSTISTGTIQGTVTDPSGAVVPNVKITIKNTATGQTVERTTNTAGVYNSGPLGSGNYTVRAENKGFQTSQLPVVVQVGVTSNGNVKMQVGAENQVVEVTSDTVRVNTEQPTVQGVLTSQQIENLPVNGRNFLDLAQLEPGVQIQDGGNFDPTKNGFSSISFGGKAGRTARITVDGIDISDENVGTTTQNVSAGAISEFQLSQSTLDLSTELTSSGSVNVVTKSGTNGLHGEGFYNFRDKSAGMADFPGDDQYRLQSGGQPTPYQRNQFGGSLGGPIIPNKLFWFLNAERVKQDQQIGISVPSLFTGIPISYGAPFRDNVVFGRLDANGPHGTKLFYKFNYNWNATTRSDAATYQPFLNKNNTPSHGVGIDFTTGAWAHSIRYGYVYFSNQIADAVRSSGIFNPVSAWPNVALRVGALGTPLRFGPNRLAPQQTFQRNNQIKYDGSKIMGAHILRFGADYNRILGGGQADFYGLGAELRTSFSSGAQAAAAAGPFAGGASNPLNYVVNNFLTSNGIGFATEHPGFGLPGGGLTDNRIAFYLGDTWKIKPTFTFTYGIRYERDTGRGPTDLPTIPCSSVDQTISQLPCTGSQDLLGQWGQPGRVHQPNNDWGPQIGFAWDPTGSGKTSIRGGAGIYYENNVWNNILFDRGLRLQTGLFNDVEVAGFGGGCGSGNAGINIPGQGPVTSFPYNGVNTPFATAICGQPAGVAAPVISALQTYIQQQQAAAGAQANPLFIGNSLTFTNMVAPKYRAPFSEQMNIGIQRQLWKDTILSVDFIRNVSLHYLINVDVNHTGDVRYFNKTAANNAVAATLSQCGVATVDAAIAACPGIYPKGGGITIDDIAANGLDSSSVPGSIAFGATTPDTGYAFAGVNPLVGAGSFLLPNGRSTYTALQMKLQQTMRDPVRGLHGLGYQFAYSFSRLNSMISTDQDFAAQAADNSSPGRFYGPSSLDRTHQFSFGGTFDIARGPRLSLVAHIFSPLARTPTLLNQFRSGEIFRTDLTGDGTVGDILPNSNIGEYGRRFNGSQINGVLSQYNATYAGRLTPAGQTVVDNGVLTASQMIALGATADSVPLAPSDQVPMGWWRTIDLRFDWPIKVTEKIALHPTVAAFNIFNWANINSSTGYLLSGVVDGSETSINGLSRSSAGVSQVRTNVGTGTNSTGAPRQLEYGLRLVF